MNWIGGARNRLRGPLKNDLKAQKVGATYLIIY